MTAVVIAAGILVLLSLVFMWHGMRTLGNVPLQPWHVACFLFGFGAGLFWGGLAVYA